MNAPRDSKSTKGVTSVGHASQTAGRPIISGDQLRQLDRDGFFVTGIVFDEGTLRGVRREFERIWGEHIAAAEKSGDALSIQQARDRPFMAQLDHRSEICRAFCRNEVFQDLGRQLIGDDVDMSWNQAIVKPSLPDGDNAFAWHQDPWYALHGGYADDSNMDKLVDPYNAITAWVAISRTIVDNGTLWVLPGGHEEGLLPHVWSEAKREWQGQFDTAWKVPVVMQAGQVLVFRKYLPHASGTNISDEARMAYQISYAVTGVKKGPSPDVSPLLRDGKLV